LGGKGKKEKRGYIIEDILMEKIATDFPYQSKYIDIFNSKMHYIEEGQGDPILLLHGVPTSSYLWRNVIPHLSPLGQCIAVDLIGMGKSDKPNIEYTIHDHIKYIEKFIETLNLKKLVIIMHGWGSIVGFHYAMHHENNCKGLVFYESYLRSINGEDVSLPYLEQIAMLEEQDILHHGTVFVDQVLPQGMMRPLMPEEVAFYRAPFLATGSGKPLHQYLQELPRHYGKSYVDDIIAEYSKKLTQSKIPKLMLYSIPGFITTIATAMWAKKHLPNLEVADVGEAFHYAQESNPILMGETISVWLQGIEQKGEI
jgi:haloalkane dehalogenase